MPVKTCSRCGLEQPLTAFVKHRQCRSGRSGTCKECARIYSLKWKRKHAERIAERRRAIYKGRYGDRHKELEARRFKSYPIRVQAERLASGVRNRSRKLGHQRPTELVEKQFFIDWLTRQPACACCGVAFLVGPKNGVKQDASPSIDRFDLTKGYSLDNISLICWRCNNIKRNYSAEDLRRVAAWIDRRSLEVDGPVERPARSEPPAPSLLDFVRAE